MWVYHSIRWTRFNVRERSLWDIVFFVIYLTSIHDSNVSLSRAFLKWISCPSTKGQLDVNYSVCERLNDLSHCKGTVSVDFYSERVHVFTSTSNSYRNSFTVSSYLVVLVSLLLSVSRLSRRGPPSIPPKGLSGYETEPQSRSRNSSSLRFECSLGGYLEIV